VFTGDTQIVRRCDFKTTRDGGAVQVTVVRWP
jgi:hypothetical protein